MHPSPPWLPLLRYELPFSEDDDDDEDEDDDNDDDDDCIDGNVDSHEGPSNFKMMFDGIRFCIFLDGWDMLRPQQREQKSTHEHEAQGQDRG